MTEAPFSSRVARCLRRAALIVACLLAPVAWADVQNTDIDGAVLGAPIDLESGARPSLSYEDECKSLCDNDRRCKVWVMVKPGVQGPKARCYLKRNVGGFYANNCCTSGVSLRAVGQSPTFDAQDYAGTFDTNSKGVRFIVTLRPDGNGVAGEYYAPGNPNFDGTLRGRLEMSPGGLLLKFTWNSHKVRQTGDGVFQLKKSGAFKGVFGATGGGGGIWDGVRTNNPPPR